MTPRAAPMNPDDRRRAIIDAVRPLLIEHGDRLTTRLIAEAAGVAEGTIFRVFADKDELMHAVAVETLNPADAREQLQAALGDHIDLPTKVRVTADLMLHRSDQVIAVLMAMRKHWMAHAKEDESPGPPAFVVQSHEALLERLTEVFEPHRDELAVTPERAALLLRTLVLGSRNPGVRPEDRLTADEVAGVLLDGIHRPRSTDPDGEGEPC
ncbi:MAG TPA: helix-turn-helix domain-containing protein [Nocardioides sp.]|uniref:TetR/AcrR family transcriptional regulator n=1 Tax=Nocardioides sp. TaxID=35761 RepID=UPI002D7EBC66|nr:helix-turn-helix domain-containing protein [Nocardioides sp.]HET6651880.1 helix-turn-helix domain-containing protein [Nocardioides sp.]